MTRILGIDPGSRRTGYGVIESVGGRTRHIAHGVIAPAGALLAQRLGAVLAGIGDAIREYRPDEIAIEEVFVKLNVNSALVLGQARGAAICAVAQAELPLHEYAPAQIKLSVVGHGRAEKRQVQHMIKMLLSLEAVPEADAADALACALCHAHMRQHRARLALAGAGR